MLLDTLAVYRFKKLTTQLSQKAPKERHLFVTNLQLQIEQKVNVSDKATDAEATAGTNDTKWMTPKTVKKVVDSKTTTYVDGRQKVLKRRNLLTPYYYSPYSARVHSGYYSPTNKHISLKNYFVYLTSETMGSTNSPNYNVYFMITDKSSLQILRSPLLFNALTDSAYINTYIVAAVPDRDNEILVMVGGNLQLIHISGSGSFSRIRTYSRGGIMSNMSYADAHPIMGKTYFCFRPSMQSGYNSQYIYGQYDDSTIYTFSQPSGWGEFYGIIGDYVIALRATVGSSAVRLDWLNMKNKQTGTASPIAMLSSEVTMATTSYTVVYDHVHEHIYYVNPTKNGNNTNCLTVTSYSTATTKILAGVIHSGGRDILIDPYTKRICGNHGLMAYDIEPTVNYIYNDSFAGIATPVGKYFVFADNYIGVLRNENGNRLYLMDLFISSIIGSPAGSWRPPSIMIMPRSMNNVNPTDMYGMIFYGGTNDDHSMAFVKYSLSNSYCDVLA